MQLYFPAFLIALCTTLGLLYALIKARRIFSFVRSPTEGRHRGSSGALRLGGVALLGGFIFALLLDKNLVLDSRTLTFMGGLLVFFIVGFIDDIKSLAWHTQLTFQALITSVVYYAGIRIDFISSPFGAISFGEGTVLLGAIVTVLWVITIINALNWSDGMNGLSGGVTFIAAVTLFTLSLRPDVYQPPLAIICSALSGAVLAFTCVNLWGGKIYAGSSGSYFMGCVIAVLAIFAGAKIGAALLVLIVPLTDALYVLFRRYRDGASLFSGDTRHLHHRLQEIGFAQWKILCLYYGLTILGAGSALLFQSWDKLIVLVVYASILFFALTYFSYQTKVQ